MNDHVFFTSSGVNVRSCRFDERWRDLITSADGSTAIVAIGLACHIGHQRRTTLAWALSPISRCQHRATGTGGGDPPRPTSGRHLSAVRRAASDRAAALTCRFATGIAASAGVTSQYVDNVPTATSSAAVMLACLRQHIAGGRGGGDRRYHRYHCPRTSEAGLDGCGTDGTAFRRRPAPRRRVTEHDHKVRSPHRRPSASPPPRGG